jgi:DNA polymerase-3 subunit epsilon
MPATWHRGPLTPFDTETTGVDVEADVIVTATVANIRPAAQTSVQSWLIAVDHDIPEAATAVHGITTEHARANGKPAVEVLDLLAAELVQAMAAGVPVVGCNLAYDFTILDRELRRHRLPTLEDRLARPIGPVIDVFVVDKHVDPYRSGGRKLTDLCKTYSVRIDGAHDATFDAMAAARVAFRIAQMTALSVDDLCEVFRDRRRPTEVATAFERLGRLSLAELHAGQVDWRREQCGNLRKHFDAKGTKHDGIPGDWPLIPHRAGAR